MAEEASPEESVVAEAEVEETTEEAPAEETPSTRLRRGRGCRGRGFRRGSGRGVRRGRRQGLTQHDARRPGRNFLPGRRHFRVGAPDPAALERASARRPRPGPRRPASWRAARAAASRSAGSRSDMTATCSTAWMPGRNRSHRALPSLGDLDQDAAAVVGVGQPTDQPWRSSRSRVLVMVAEEIRVRSLISLGVSGSSAPSMTARVLVICLVDAERGGHDTIELARDQHEAGAHQGRVDSSVEAASASGYSVVKSSPTRTTPRDAKEGGPLPAFLDLRRRGSDKLEDLDPGCAGDAGGVHGVA